MLLLEDDDSSMLVDTAELDSALLELSALLLVAMLLLELSALLKIGNAEAVRHLASYKPDLGERLGGAEPQKALDAYFAERADAFEPYRKFVARGLSLPVGSTAVNFTGPGDSGSAGSETWEKVFQILAGRENDGKESSNL